MRSISIRSNHPTILYLIVALWTTTSISACVYESGEPLPGTIGDGRFKEIVQQIVRLKNIPALTVGISRDGEIVDSASAGVRSFETSVGVTENDQWQIGSLTKAVTATLAARLIELGLLQWESRIDELFSEHIDQIDTSLHDITLSELLQHRAGLRRVLMPTEQEKAKQDRLGLVLRAMKENHRLTRGKFRYSNLGYVIAGAMIEKATGIRWEQAVEAYLFSELNITDYGFGVPDPGTDLSQPIGHIRYIDGSGERINEYWFSVIPEHDKNLPRLKLYAPAGGLYLSKQNYLKFQKLHLDGAKGISDFLSQSSFKRLQIPAANSDYAMGWMPMESDNLERFNLSPVENTVEHNGFIGSWMAYSLLLPDRNISIFIASNSPVSRYFDAIETTLNVTLKRLQVTE